MSLLERGFTRPVHLFGIPFRVHFTVPIGLLIISRFQFAPGFWLGFLLVLIVHELGHAALVRRRGLRVVGIDLTGFGGLCKHTLGTPRDTVIIAWGGVLGQLALGLLAFGLRGLVFARLGGTGADAYAAMTEYSAMLAGLNLLPLPGLDGAEAWKILKDLRRSPEGSGRGRRPSEPARRRGEERGVVVKFDDYKAKRRAGDDAEPKAHPSVRAELEAILKDASKKRRDGDKRTLN